MSSSKVSNGIQNFLSLYQILERNKYHVSNFHDTPASAKADLRTSSPSKLEKLACKIIPHSYNTTSLSKYARYTMPLSHFTGHNLWLLKPTGLNRGRGIHVFRDLDILKEIILNDYGNKKECTSISL